MIRIVQDDITTFEGNVIVNAANQYLEIGGGVDGAIHRAAGPMLVASCRDITPVVGSIRCPLGYVRVTPGFSLRADYVFHTVGPIYDEPESENCAKILRQCFENCGKVLSGMGLRTIAFPAISAGVFGYPMMECANIALQWAVKFDVKNEDVGIYFYIPGANDFRVWERVLAQNQLLRR